MNFQIGTSYLLTIYLKEHSEKERQDGTINTSTLELLNWTLPIKCLSKILEMEWQTMEADETFCYSLQYWLIA